MKRYIVGITGASGSIYALRLIEELNKRACWVSLIATQTADEVVPFETKQSIKSFVQNLSDPQLVRIEHRDNLFSETASGSKSFAAMIIVPCSIGSLSSIAHGISRNLLDRAAQVSLKERRKLLICPREMPLSTIALKNMTILSENGAVIMPCAPGFYHHPSSLEHAVDFVVGKILDQLEIDHDLYKKWEGR